MPDHCHNLGITDNLLSFSKPEQGRELRVGGQAYL